MDYARWVMMFGVAQILRHLRKDQREIQPVVGAIDMLHRD
jgi:hypothetical protein